jgi:hypothetical protein
MKTIAIVTTADADGEHIAPAAPFPANAIAIQCDGTKYTVYEPGDTVPVLS